MIALVSIVVTDLLALRLLELPARLHVRTAPPVSILLLIFVFVVLVVCCDTVRTGKMTFQSHTPKILPLPRQITEKKKKNQENSEEK